MKRTKIVATLGPASLKPGVLKKLLFEGVNVFRINFSHGSPEENRKTILSVKKLLTETKKHASILADLQGPKLRIGTMKANTKVLPGDNVVFTNISCVGDKKKVFMKKLNPLWITVFLTMVLVIKLATTRNTVVN